MTDIDNDMIEAHAMMDEPERATPVLRLENMSDATFLLLPRVVTSAGGGLYVPEPDYPDPKITAGHWTGPFETREEARAFIRQIVQYNRASLIR